MNLFLVFKTQPMKKNSLLFLIFGCIAVVAFLNFVTQLVSIQFFSCKSESTSLPRIHILRDSNEYKSHPIQKRKTANRIEKMKESPSARYNFSLTAKDDFCTSWDTNLDEWWTQHPEYFIKVQNTSHQCFRRDITSEKARFMIEMYRIQHDLPCDNYISRFLWNSGWGADTGNLIVGLYQAYQEKRPFVVSFEYPEAWPFWHYASLKPLGSAPVCPSKDTECYFLKLNNCNIPAKAINTKKCIATEQCRTKGHWWDIPKPYDYWTYVYLTRSKQWMRKKVVDFIEHQKPNLPKGGKCTIMHVRRGDIILHKKISSTREYLPISAYLERLPTERKSKGSNIIIMTDDQNAIEEAYEFFPDINWFHFDRKRFRGTEGGWENQLPTKNPAEEVTAIIATLEVVQMCDAIVRQKSNLGEIMVRSMRSVHGTSFQEYYIMGYRYGRNQTRSSHESLAQELRKEREKRNQSGNLANVHNSI